MIVPFSPSHPLSSGLPGSWGEDICSHSLLCFSVLKQHRQSYLTYFSSNLQTRTKSTLLQRKICLSPNLEIWEFRGPDWLRYWHFVQVYQSYLYYNNLDIVTRITKMKTMMIICSPFKIREFLKRQIDIWQLILNQYCWNDFIWQPKVKVSMLYC